MAGTDDPGVGDVAGMVKDGVGVAETGIFLGALLLLIKLVVDALEAAPVLDFNSSIDDVIETVFAPLGWITDVVLE